MEAVASGQSVGGASQRRVRPLVDFPVGERVRVVEIGAGPATVRRCLGLGLTVGAELTVQRRRGRAVVVASGGNRVALGAEIASHVLVERLD